jgi:hypothetical protein
MERLYNTNANLNSLITGEPLFPHDMVGSKVKDITTWKLHCLKVVNLRNVFSNHKDEMKNTITWCTVWQCKMESLQHDVFPSGQLIVKMSVFIL